MTTFSQLVDALVFEHLRPDLRAAIASYVNLTIRELHQDKQTGGTILYTDNLLEDQVVADAAEGFQWDIPTPHLFQKIAAVRFDTFGTDKNAFAQERTPANLFVENRFDRYFYRSGGALTFINYGGEDAVITLAWFQFPPQLTYYATAARPAVWNPATQAYTYSTDYNTTDEAKAEARTLSTNWILQRWEELVMQGARAKIFSRVGDVERSRLAFSSFDSLRPGIVATETYR